MIDDHYISGLLASSFNFGHKMVANNEASLKQSLCFPNKVAGTKEQQLSQSYVTKDYSKAYDG